MAEQILRNRDNISNLVAGLQLTDPEQMFLRVRYIGEGDVYGIEVSVYYKFGVPAWVDSLGGFGEAFAPNFFWRDFEKSRLEFQLKHNNQHYSGVADQCGCHGDMRAVFTIYSDKPIRDSTLIQKMFELHRIYR